MRKVTYLLWQGLSRPFLNEEREASFVAQVRTSRGVTPQIPQDKANRLFWARLAGPQQTFAVSPDDTCIFNSAGACDALDALHDSDFTPREWAVRTEGVHARSKTFS